MRKSMMLSGLLALFLVGSTTAVIAATQEIYVVNPTGSVEHDVFTNPPGENWNHGAYACYNSDGSYQDVSFQFSLAGLAGKRIKSVTITFVYYCDSPNNDPTIPCGTLNHYGGSATPTGDAMNDKLFGSDYLATCYFPGIGVGWTDTSVDVTALVQADIAKGHQWAVFSLNHVENAGTGTGTWVYGGGGFGNTLFVDAEPIAISGADLLLLED
jgi:hypothetical protein